MNLKQTEAVIQSHLNEISKYFKPECRLTFIMHNPSVDDGDMILTNDTLEGIETVIKKHKERL